MTATQENGWELSITLFTAAPPAKAWDVMAMPKWVLKKAGALAPTS